MIEHFLKRLVEDSLWAGSMGDGGAVVHLQSVRHTAGAVCDLSQHRLERSEVFRLTFDGPFPFRIREHRMAKFVVEATATDGYVQLSGIGPVKLKPLPRLVKLLEEGFFRPIFCPPGSETALQGPQLTIDEMPRIT